MVGWLARLSNSIALLKVPAKLLIRLILDSFLGSEPTADPAITPSLCDAQISHEMHDNALEELWG